MFDQLRQQGKRASGTPKQVKNTYLSAVFRCPTETGDVYLKILPHLFIRETQVIEQLTAWRMPELPRYLAIDSERGLALMEDMGGCDLVDCCTTALLERVVRELADFQVASTSRIPLENPWPFYDWRMGVLAEETECVAQNAQALLAASAYALSEKEMDRLRGSLRGWRDLCDRIVERGLPDALEHGDLRPGNIRIVGERIIFYDWAWSAIAHPFMSITSLLHTLRRSVAEAEETKKVLRDAYLEAWTGYAPLNELRQIFDLVDRARTLYYVIGDAMWLRCLKAAFSCSRLSPISADAWTLQWRQYYYAQVVRRLFEPVN
jgi:aminoglycoside/choline kinase family phosphotransferase